MRLRIQSGRDRSRRQGATAPAFEGTAIDIVAADLGADGGSRWDGEGHGTTAYLGNPPYLRHYDLPPKTKAWAQTAAALLGRSVSGLAGVHGGPFYIKGGSLTVGVRGIVVARYYDGITAKNYVQGFKVIADYYRLRPPITGSGARATTSAAGASAITAR